MSAQLAGAATNALLSFVLLMLVARWLGPARFGDYVATLSAALIALIFIEAGWPSLVYRDGVAAPDRAHPEGLTAQAVMHIVLATALIASIAFAVGPSDQGAWAAIACVGCVAAMNLVSARMRAHGRFALEAAWQVAGRVVSAVSVAIVLTQVVQEPTGIFLAWAAGLVVCLLVGASRWLPWPRRVRWTGGLALALPFMMIEGALAFLIRGDVALLAAMGLSKDALAQYAACTRFTEAGLLVFSPVANVLVRELRLRRAAHAEFDALLRHALLLAAGLGLAAVALTAVVGGHVLVFAFGDGFENAAGLFPRVVLMLPFALCNLTMVQALIAVGAERFVGRALVVTVVSMPLALAVGTGIGGVAGASLALASLHAVLSIACLACLRRAVAVT